MYDAVRMMRYAAHQYERQRVRRVWNASKMHAKEGLEETHEAFACHHLCGDCGHLFERSGACPHCGQKATYDLRNKEVASRLREWEETERHSIPRSIKRTMTVVAVLSTLVTLAVMLGLACLLDDAFLIVLVGIAAVAVAGAVYGVITHLAVRWVTWLYYRNKRLEPLRWKLPIPKPGADTPVASTDAGEAAGEATVTAPFSRRPCLGYRAVIIFDIKGDARPPRCVLDECEVTDFTLGGRTIEGGRTTLIGDFEAVPLDDSMTSDADLARFLRKRGLYLTDGTLDFLELRLEAGQPCRATFPEKSSGVGPIVDVRP
jgi:hypothetical protein